MGILNIKKNLEGQGSLQTETLVGVYDSNETETFGYAGGADTPVASNFVQEGYVVYDYIPCIGGKKQLAKDWFVTSILNEFVETRGKNVSLSSYNLADVGKWLLAAGGINVLSAEIKRALKANYLPDSLKGDQSLKAGLTIVPSKLLSNKVGNDDIANYIEQYNQAVDKIRGIRVPKNVPMIDYWYKLSNCIYKEDSLKKGQNFFFRCVAIPMWDCNGVYGDAGNIVFRRITSSTDRDSDLDLDIMLSLFDQLISTYVTDQTCANMFAEFTHADNSDSYDITHINIDEIRKGIEIRTDVDVLFSIKNANIVPIAKTEIENINIHEITTTSGSYALQYGSEQSSTSWTFENIAPLGSYTASNLAQEYSGRWAMKLYNCHKDKMSSLDNFNALQFTTITSRTGSDYFTIEGAGLVLLIGLHTATVMSPNSVIKGVNIYSNNMHFPTTVNVQQVYAELMRQGAVNNIATLLQFTAIPTIVFSNASSSAQFKANMIIDDCDNTQIISYDNINKILDAINKSLVSKD